jgi:hypothetical protein
VPTGDDEIRSRLGLDEGGLASLREWTRVEHERGVLGWPGVFLDLSTAQEFSRRFLQRRSEIKLLSLHLPQRYVEEFLAEAHPQGNEEPSGFFSAVNSGVRATAEGRPLGFEPLGFDQSGFHSFLCNSLEEDYSSRLGLVLNEHGRFSELEDSEAAVHYTRLDSTGAEPALWQPWLVVEYT